MSESKSNLSERLMAIAHTYALPDAGRTYLQHALQTDPHSNVLNQRRSVTGNFSSCKLGASVQSGNLTRDLASLYRWEWSPHVRAFIDRPPPLDLPADPRFGCTKLLRYEPAYLVLYDDAPSLVEIREQCWLVERVKSHPSAWKHAGDSWINLRAVEICQSMGFRHEVVNASESSRLKTANLRTLVQARENEPLPDEATTKRILSVLEQSAWTTLEDLYVRSGVGGLGPIYQLIHNRRVFVDLEKALLTRPSGVVVAADEAILKAAGISLSEDPAIEPIPVEHMLTRSQAEYALAKLELARSTCKSKMARRARKRLHEGQAKGLGPLESLRSRNRGRPTSQLPKVVRDFVIAHIAKSKGSSVGADFADYLNKAGKKHPGLSHASETTYRRYVALSSPVARANRRGGERAANAAEPLSEVGDRQFPFTRPFESASMDHTLLKILLHVLVSDGWRFCRRPWLTVLVDNATGMILAWHVSLAAPSRKAVAILLRNCLREHGRLPEIVHTDRGREFTSVYLQALAADRGFTLTRTPVAHSRYNDRPERVNGHIRTRWIAKRPGNIVDYTEKRAYSDGCRPQDLAVITLEKLRREIQFFVDHLNTNAVGTALQPPWDLFDAGLKLHGYSGRPMPFDDNFRIATAVEPHASKYSVSDRGDIVFNNMHFSHRKLRQLPPRNRKVEIREEVENPYRIYACVDGQWVTARTGKDLVFETQGPDERIVESVLVSESRPARERARLHSRKAIAKEVARLDSALIAAPPVATKPSTPSLFEQARERAAQTMTWETKK